MHTHSEQEKEEEKGMPIVVVKDGTGKMTFARVVPQKGVEPYAVGSIVETLEQLGYKTVVLRSDNEPALLALKVAVRKEIEVELIKEEVPVGDYQANGLVENAVKNVQG